MKVQTPQISWHGRDAVLSVDFQFIHGEICRLATGGIDTHVVVWYYSLGENNVVTIECASDLNRHNKSVNVVRFSPNGEYLASGDDEGAIFVWKLREKMLPELDGEEENVNKEDWYVFKILRGHIDDISDLCWSSDSEFLMSGSIDNSTIIWDIQKGQNIRISKEAKSFVQGVAWDPLNQFQATISSDRMLRIYNTASGKVIHRIHKAHWTESTIDKSSKKVAKLFHDDTLQSYCRRLKFSPDGELLFVPSGIKEKGDDFIHTTYVFSRYDFTRPILNLPTGQKYSLAVCCCPVLFKLQGDLENVKQKSMVNLPYRLLMAVATQDAILIYDSQQLLPCAYICNIHYRHLTDLSWSSDGRMLLVSSTDGYCSFIIFAEGELGEIYIPEKKMEVSPVSNTITPVAITPNQKSIKKYSKPDSLSPVEKAANGDLEKEALVFGEGGKSPSPFNKPKTPNQTPVSVKKSKMLSIKRFFSTPDRSKVKIIDDSDDCMIIEEKLNGQTEKLRHKSCEPMLVATDQGDCKMETNTGEEFESSFEKEIGVSNLEICKERNGSTIGLSNERLFPALNQAKAEVVNKIENYMNFTSKNNASSGKTSLPSSDIKQVQKFTDITPEVKVVLNSMKGEVENRDCKPESNISKSLSVSMEVDAVIPESSSFPITNIIPVPCSEVKSIVTSAISPKGSLPSTQDIEIMDVRDEGERKSDEGARKSEAIAFPSRNLSDCVSSCSSPSTSKVQQFALPQSNSSVSNNLKLSENKPKKRIPFITLSTKVTK